LSAVKRTLNSGTRLETFPAAKSSKDAGPTVVSGYATGAAGKDQWKVCRPSSVMADVEEKTVDLLKKALET